MKRIISYLVVFVLVFSSGIPSYASEADLETAESTMGSSAPEVLQAEEGTEDTGTADDGLSDAENDENEEEPLTEEPVRNKGQVDVSIQSAMILEKEVEFTVSLTGQEDQKIILLRDSEEPAARGGATFEGLEAGVYTLTVTAPGFAGFSQEILVEDWAYLVQLTAGFVSGYVYNEASRHPGVLLVGDVDGNGVIDDTDKELLIDDIEAGSGYSPNSDLNGDGVVDIVDLEYFVKGYQVSGDISSSIEINVPAAAVDIKSDDATIVDGDISSLLKSKENVKLSRADGRDISEDCPVSVEFQFPEDRDFTTDGIVIEAAQDDRITAASVDITYMENGKEEKITVPLKKGVDFLLYNSSIAVTQDIDGTICINLGAQIAVKKVSLKIMGMEKNTTLAEIARVEFVNGMEDRISPPDLDIPQNAAVQAANKKFTVTWDACRNVTGYEVMITSGSVQETKYIRGNSLSVSSLNNEKLVNNQPYEVKVRSVNGAWRSGYSETVTAVPKADKKPDAPDNLKTSGLFKAVSASWKKMEDTDTYSLYYKEADAEEFIKIEGITTNSYTIQNLKNITAYEVYVTGVNELGEGKPSLTSVAETTDPNPADMPKYKRINAAGEGEVSEHIISTYAGKGSMQDSPLDTQPGTAWGTVDNNPVSCYYHGSWDSGGFNALNGNDGLVYEFDQAYRMQAFAFQEVSVQNIGYSYVQVRYWDENGKRQDLGKVSITRKTDAGGRVYYMVKLPEAVTAVKLQFGMARYVASGVNTISEVYFYHYDTLEDDIMALYEDDLHTVLKEGVTQEVIDALRTRINMPDEVSGEYHPDREKLEKELKTAEEILRAKLTDPVYIHNSITTNDVNRGFGGLNAWQPLGITAEAGEELTVYVGHNSKKTGETANLQLVATQYHAESGGMSKVVSTLKIGRNDITVPQLSSVKAEAGGALYVQYTGAGGNDRYAVRVSGGSPVPVLDLYQVSGRAERLAKAEEYIVQLDDYVSHIGELHEEIHSRSENKLIRYDYDAKNCILGAADIMLDTMLLSLPAQQIWAGTGSGSTAQRAQKLIDSMDAVEGMMNLFYQHKGLNNSAENVRDRFPAGHLNIRYQRMFAGAFMYASGNHIGIEWNETAGMMSGVPVQAEENGKYVSGRYFGWGIAHEIGHCINQGTYAIAEITNNYYSVLAQAKDTNDSVRFKYGEVYKKVTSGTAGRASNVFTQLGMYWQLHLAYDTGYNYKTYENHGEQLENLFFARVDSYARNTGSAPAPGGISLELSGNVDQKLMRLSCAAARKDILEFFERWGMTPDEGTRSYASQFEKETRAIYYVNDDSRVYRMENGGSSLDSLGSIEAVGDETRASVNQASPNQADFVLSSKNIPEEDVLGYEIVRCTISEGEESEETAGFVTSEEAKKGTFSDLVTTMNNRVVIYKITVIDKYLNRSAVKILDPLKIEHDGSIDKAGWTVTSSNMQASCEAGKSGEDADTTCGPEEERPIEKIIDGNSNTTYTGEAGAGAEIVLEFHKLLTVTGFKYTVKEGAGIKDYVIYVRDEKGEWIEAADGTFTGDEVQTIYFTGRDGANIASYKAAGLKLVIKKQADEIAVSEMDVLGITGDNVDFRRTGDGTAAIGRLGSDYVYGDKKEDLIPAGSIVFTGAYKGNPAYNVIILYDQDGNIVGGVDEEGNLNAYQTILAEIPKTGKVEDVADGTWIYWIEPGDAVNLSAIRQVRAELYRVDNAETNEGQRMVSDSLFETVPEELPEIQIHGDGKNMR